MAEDCGTSKFFNHLKIYFILFLQEALCAMNFSHLIDLVTKVTNLIQKGSRFLKHRKFIAFLDEVSAAYGAI